mgnify:CR=1 FL=1
MSTALTAKNIEDPLALIAYINEKIAKTETMLETVQDERLWTKLNGQLLGWVEMLEKALHQAYQQGRTKKDATKL